MTGAQVTLVIILGIVALAVISGHWATAMSERKDNERDED